MKFIGRTNELSRLAALYRQETQTAAIIFGRRRVGKSALIMESLKRAEALSIYYECKETTEKSNVEGLSTLVSETFGYPRLAYDSLEALLEFLFQEATKRPLILVLDEYPYLRSAIKGMDSIMQSLLDKYRESKMHLILCGSFVDTMKSLLMTHNPLYGRLDFSLHLKAMDYYDAARFYPDFSSEDKVLLYSVLGGIPYYCSLISPDLSAKENIMRLMVEPGARLENEVSMYLSSELSKMTNANEVFEALAKGFSRFSDILSQSYVSSSPTLVDILRRLMQMDMVEKEAPINDEGNKKKAGYYIADNMSLFYYRYIFRYASQRRVMEPGIFFARYIEQDLMDSYVPKRFEAICRQYLIRQNRQGLMDEPFEQIGKFYYNLPKEHKNGEFDVVTKDQKGYIFYEAKFRKQPVTDKMIEEEISQVKATGLSCYKYGFFSRSGYEDMKRNDVVCFDLDDLYR